LEIAQWLLAIGADIHAEDDAIFRWSCGYGRLNTAKWLHANGANIYANNDEAFRWSCLNGHLEIAQWLCSIEPAYIYVIENGKITYKIRNIYVVLYESQKYDQLLEKLNIPAMIDPINESCIICYDQHQYMLLTDCNHVLCIECMYQYKYKYEHNICPYCRKILKFKGYTKD
jgi:hypothetical protein